MNDRVARKPSRAQMPRTRFEPIDVLTAAVAGFAIIFALLTAWAFIQISGLRAQLSAVRTELAASQQETAALAQKLGVVEGSLSGDLARDADDLRNQIVQSASAKLDHSISAAMSELSSFGNSNFVFHMSEFERRSCVKGGTFIGEQPDGSLQEETFDANHMVEIQPSHEDIRGIPFYRVTINDQTLQSAGGPGAYRHGTMRISCS
ncbi:hypothetical protein [Hoeflea poritis]|uniref:Uncharacterized protein n=1 Tax=Hoeflea poritis TaxID=2993659 RepID=A0ABT4VPS8_9HYPH|nr:hypothetical protein [Hoeflea poritis]MDA4846710.1 hypothetical protein [Hoeflea poritis]